jgi:hypothetical protein
MLSLRLAFAVGVALAMLAGLSGCSGGPSVVPVTGVLTYKGKPVTNAYIDFLPEKGRPSVGQTDERGWFKLEYDPQNSGAVVGKHKVSVRMRPTTQAEKEAAMLGKALNPGAEMTAFFNKYSAENSKIEVVVDRDTRELKLEWD